MSNVSILVKSIQDIMRKDAGTYGDAQRLEQLGWMLFLKIFDDREKELKLFAITTNRRCLSTFAGQPGPPTQKESPAMRCSIS